MNITPPPQLNDKFDMSYDEINEAIAEWILNRHLRVLAAPVRMHLTTNHQFTCSGELKPKT